MPTETNIPAVIDGPLNDMMSGLHSVRIEAEDIRDRLTDLIELADPQVELANEIVIEDIKGVEKARDYMRNDKVIEKGIDSKFEPITNMAYKLHKATVAMKKAMQDIRSPGRDIVQDKLNTYYAAEEAKRIQSAQEAEKEGIIAPPVPVVDGVSVKHKKKAVLVDKLKFLKAAMNPNSGVSLDLVTFDMKSIDKLINNGMELPGWTSITETTAKVK